MNKWKLIVPVGIISVGAAVAASLLKKNKNEAVPKEAAKKAAAPANIGSGTYSFVSGYKDAATFRLGVKYDADAFTFAVVSEDYLVYSGDSHVAILSSEDYNVQIEYAPYYSGEGFAQLCGRMKEKYADLKELKVSGINAIRYIEGDAVVTCVEVDEYSYIMIYAMKAKDSKIELPDIVYDAPLAFVFNSLEITKA